MQVHAPVKPPAAPGAQPAPAIYWSYWGASFATVLAWVFTVAAAADDAWIEDFEIKLGEECSVGEICSLYKTATAFQFITTIVASVALVLVGVACFMNPPFTKRLGLSTGILLVLASLFQLIAFSCMASAVQKVETVTYYTSIYSSSYTLAADLNVGATFGLAIVAFVLLLITSIMILVFCSRATSKGGPLTMCIGKGAAKESAGPQSAAAHASHASNASGQLPAYSETV